MDLSKMIESKYLKQSDIDSDTLVTIESLKKVNVARDDEDPEYRWTCKFHEFAKPMVLNVTNIKRLGKALGNDTDMWIDKQVVLYVDPDIEFGGNVVGGLRLRGQTRKATPKKAGDEDINRQFQEAVDKDSEVPF